MTHLILVVDDEPTIREVLGELLADEGYRVRCACDGHEALTIAAQDPPDVLVSDVRMPRIGGVELVRRLRARGQDVPVVFVSTHFVDVPGIRHLRKPFDLDEIMAAVAASLVVG